MTGAGGFVGSAVVRRLLLGDARFSDGAPVEHIVALLRPRGSAKRLEELPRDGTWSVAHADVADSSVLRAVVEQTRPRAIVHAALDARVYAEDDERLIRNPLEALLGGLGGTAARFLQVGSAWVLESGEGLDESAPLAPLTPYARNKAREEALVPTLAKRAGIPWVNLRLFNLFGRHEKPSRLLPTLVAKLSRGETAELTQGEQVRDFNDVDVAAQAFVDALAVPDHACGAVYHIGSGLATSVRELALMVSEIVGGEELLRFGAAGAEDEGMTALVADPSRATRVLGWHPDRDLQARLRTAVEWWIAQSERPARGVTA